MYYFSNFSRDLFFNKTTGDVLEIGDTMYFLKLAKTLRVIAEEGGDTFYNGKLSEDILADLKDVGRWIIFMFIYNTFQAIVFISWTL